MADVANDGQNLWSQDTATQNMFIHTFGSEPEANAAWVEQHNAQIGGGGGGGGGGGSSSSGSSAAASSGSSWVDEFFKNQAGQDAAAAKTQAKQFGQSLAVKKQELKGQIAYWQGQIKNQAKQIEVEKGRAAADAWYQQREVELALLTHQIQLGELGEKYINDAVQYASTPDNYWKLLDFQAGAASRQDVPLALQALQKGVSLPAFQEHGGQPTAKNPGDLLSLLGYQGSVNLGQPVPFGPNAPALQSQQGLGVSASGAAVGAGTMGDAGPTGQRLAQQAITNAGTYAGSKSPVIGGTQPATAPTEGGMGQTPIDPRSAAVAGIAAAMPPSNTPGWSGQDVAAINSIMQTYASPQSIAPGVWESTDPEAKKLILAGMARGGGDPAMFISNWEKSRINQGNAMAA